MLSVEASGRHRDGFLGVIAAIASFDGAVQRARRTIAKTRRRRDKRHRQFVASQACVICGASRRTPIICVSRSREALA
jgi:ribosomal protein L32